MYHAAKPQVFYFGITASVVILLGILLLAPSVITASTAPTETPTQTVTQTVTVSQTPTPTSTSSAEHLQSGQPVAQTGLPDLIISDVRLLPNFSSSLNCDLSDETVLLVVVANYGASEASAVSLKVREADMRLITIVTITGLSVGDAISLRLPITVIGKDGLELDIDYAGQESSKDNNMLMVTWKQLVLSYTAVPHCTPTFTPSMTLVPSMTLTPSITLTPTDGPSPTPSNTITATPT
ncbi:MAG: hypothetical protein ABI947_03875 [Chloroflexota bacterium]